jgi:hypothetical protein
MIVCKLVKHGVAKGFFFDFDAFKKRDSVIFRHTRYFLSPEVNNA